MPINDKFFAARDAEARQRLISYLPYPPAVLLPAGAGRKIAFKVVHLTPRHVAELGIVGNPFIGAGETRPAHLFEVLWRLHPDFIRPSGEQPNRNRQAGFFARVCAWRRRARIARLVRQLRWPHAAVELRRHLELAYQDKPCGESEGAARSRIVPHVFWIDDLCDHYSRTYTLSPAGVIDMPIAQLYQLYRNHVLATDPEAELKIFSPADDLLSP